MSETLDEKQRVSTTQPDPTDGNQEVHGKLMALYDERYEMGKRKYKTPLKTRNGRSFLKDALEESMDQSLYLMGLILEEEENKDFKGILWMIQILDGRKQYFARNLMIYKALAIASENGIPAGIRVDPKEPEWPVVFFELPTGQISWHVNQFEKEWDGHTTSEKYIRLQKFIES